MNITHINKKAGGFFEARKETCFAGKLTYNQEEHIMIINHTEVDSVFQGKGVGKNLVRKAADFAREKELKVIAKCSYAKKLMERTPEYEDVLFKPKN